MKVLIIYCSECRSTVERIRGEIADRFGKQTVLRSNTPDRKNQMKKKIHLKHFWHIDAARMIELADMIVYVVSENSAVNKNVEWEIRKSIAKDRYIVCLKLSEDVKINDSLYVTDKHTKKTTCLADVVNNEEEIYSIINNFNHDSHINLIHKNFDVNILLEQYKVFSETAESLVTRRQNMNSFYISANTALITIGATVFALSEGNNMISKLIIVLALSIPGILLNISWRSILRSYFINNRGKMKVLSIMEQHLAASSYDAEWRAMKNRFNKEKYVSFTDGEKRLPLIFILFYVLAGISAIVFMIIIGVK